MAMFLREIEIWVFRVLDQRDAPIEGLIAITANSFPPNAITGPPKALSDALTVSR